MTDPTPDPEMAAWLAQKEAESEAKRKAAFEALERKAHEPGVSLPGPSEPPLGQWNDER